MNSDLFSYLCSNMGQPISAEIASDIMVYASQLSTLVHFDAIEKLPSGYHRDFLFAVEKIEDIEEEIKPLHQAHWSETEAHRHGIELKPDYDTFARYERAGRYILFTLRKDGRLLGNCTIYLTKSAHTQTLMGKEDTLYLLPEARVGRTAAKFIDYCEQALKQLGVREVCVSVKTANKAGLFFQMLGYKHVENGLTKVLEI